jgi:transposase
MRTRRKFSPELKAQIVLEILKEEKSISQMASEHEIHPVQLSQWKTQAIKIFHSIH